MMFPILYESTENSFTSNGLGRLRDCISCIVTEGRNDVYECDFEYPADGVHFEDIYPGRIIAVTHDDTGDVEPFDIVSYTKPINGVVTFHAVHISYRQSSLTTYGTNVNSISDAFAVFENAEPSNPFTYASDINSSAYMASMDGTPRSVRQFIGGIEGSMLDTYGGELEWKGFNVYLRSARGSQRDVTIRYGVNMLDYNEQTDYQGAFTSCIPYWTGTDNNGADVKVIGDRVDLGLTGFNGRNDCVPLDLTDKFETKPTKAQVEAEALSQMQANQTNLPASTITVDFVRLQDLDDYADYVPLQSCSLCDIVTVIFPYYGTSGQFKIVKTIYNVLREKYDSLELGTLQTSLSEALGITNSLDRATGGGGAFVPTVVTFSGTANNFTSGTTLHSLGVSEILASGTWLVLAECRYASSSTGYRAIQITADGTGQNVSLMQTPAGGTGNVDLVTSAIIEKTASWTLDVNGRQNSGSSMNVDWYVKAVKIAE